MLQQSPERSQAFWGTQKRPLSSEKLREDNTGLPGGWGLLRWPREAFRTCAGSGALSQSLLGVKELSSVWGLQF